MYQIGAQSTHMNNTITYITVKANTVARSKQLIRIKDKPHQQIQHNICKSIDSPIQMHFYLNIIYSKVYNIITDYQNILRSKKNGKTGCAGCPGEQKSVKSCFANPIPIYAQLLRITYFCIIYRKIYYRHIIIHDTL